MKKYKVTQEFMDSLEGWRVKFLNGEIPVNALTAENRYNVVELWRFEHLSDGELMKRLGALINWINGEDVFEIGTPKYIVKRKEVVSPAGREYLHIYRDGSLQFVYSNRLATKFDDYMKAREWAGIHFEVVEVDE